MRTIKRIKLMCVLIGLLIPPALVAQEKIQFHSIITEGFAVGKSGGFGVLQTINGLEYKKIFAGAGVGIDYYKDKTIPLFFDIRTAIAKTKFFVFNDIGYNFPRHNKPGKDIYYSTYHFSGGVYNELGLGYKILLARKTYLLFSSGYSYKELNNSASTTVQCLVAPCAVDYSKYRYGYGRIVFKAGVSF